MKSSENISDSTSNQEKIKYNTGDHSSFVTELRKRVNHYFSSNGISKHGNVNMLFKTLLMLAVYIVPYGFMVSGLITTPGLIFVMYITMGLGIAGIGLSIMHDANHKAYSKHQAVNRILSYTLNLLGGFAYNWQYQHNTLHHRYTNIEGYDEDIDPVGNILRFSPHKPLRKYHRFMFLYAWFFYGLITLQWTLDKDIRQIIRYKKAGVALDGKRSYGWIITELIISKLLYYTYILVIPILILPVAWWIIILAYLSMHFVGGFILGIIFQTAHVMPEAKYPLPAQDGTMGNSWAVHQLMTTSDYSPRSRLFSWLIGGLNYQVEHHLFPAICHVHYRHIAAIVKETALEYKLPYHVQPNFGIALFRHTQMLKSLGKA